MCTLNHLKIWHALKLSDDSIISLSKVTRHVLAETHVLSHIDHVGDVLYIFSVAFGLISWGFAIVWFIIAVMMIGTAGRFPFNMGWWGFIFPIGKESSYTLIYFTLE